MSACVHMLIQGAYSTKVIGYESMRDFRFATVYGNYMSDDSAFVDLAHYIDKAYA